MKLILLATLFSIVSCASDGDKARQQSALNKVNVDKVLKKGTDQVTVLEVLGSPNTVSSNGNGEEVWGYLKSARNSESSSIGSTIWDASIKYTQWGYIGGDLSNSKTSTSDTTLIVYFDKNKRVTNHNFRTEMY